MHSPAIPNLQSGMYNKFQYDYIIYIYKISMSYLNNLEKCLIRSKLINDERISLFINLDIKVFLQFYNSIKQLTDVVPSTFQQ